MSFWDLFLDPLYRGSVLGSMLMCLSSSLMGALMFVKKRSLVCEALSHAAYPGVMLSVLFAAALFSPNHPFAMIVVLIGALLFSYIGLEVIENLRRRFRIHLDAALCFVLSTFLGIGVVFASRIQFSHPVWYQQSKVFIYGQAATMSDLHVMIYGALSLLVVFYIFCRFREIEFALFDRQYAPCQGLHVPNVMKGVFFLLILSIVIGIRSVGVILMSGMLVAPAAAARCFTNRFSTLLILSGCFGVASALIGNLLSIQMSMLGLTFPTGPMILLTSAVFAILSLIFAPQKGVCFRAIRRYRFRQKCLAENILKTLWKGEGTLSKGAIKKWNAIGTLSLFNLQREGWIERRPKGHIALTPDGMKRATRLVRLHRLWELYLVSCLKVDEQRVHCSAEEMEHILTPELECQLTALLNNPSEDPHNKPIPQGETVC